MKKPKLINLYISKKFLLTFCQIAAGFSLLIFFINLLDLIDRIADSGAPLHISAFMAFLQIPNFLNDVVSSLVLMSAIISFFFLSSKSEITIIRMSGFSLWQVLYPMAVTAVILGVFWVTIIGSITVQMTKKFNTLEGKYTRNDSREVVAPKGGIWLKQINIQNSKEEIIIKAKKVFRENMEFQDVSFWFFDRNGQFYKKINAEEMFLKDDHWLLRKVTINDDILINKTAAETKVATDLKQNFVTTKILNNFQDVNLFTIFELPNLIKDLKNAGFNTTKFKVYLNSLLCKPLLFLAMVLIACYFGLNHIRNNNSIFMIFLGIVVGLIFYITSSIINSLGSSGLIPIFASTWVIAIICLAIGTLLIYSKESF
jgi:lipopolysaccharide export system permease protein